MYRRIILILVIELFYLFPVKAYQEQELQPVNHFTSEPSPRIFTGRTYNVYPDVRVLASKQSRYPALDQLEHLLYPNQKFDRENPGLRLERLEIAVFGVKQSGNVQERLHKLQSEIENWQIANMQVLDILPHTSNTTQQAYKIDDRQEQKVAYVNHYQQPYSGTIGLSQLANQARKRDYDYLNYRLATPIIQNIGRQSVSAMFRRNK